MRGNVTEVISHLKKLTPEIARREHIRIAREGLERVLSKTPGVPYRIIVDGKPSTSEYSVKPFGVIKYVFIRMGEVAKLALVTARDMSPVQSGRYKRSWVLIVDGKTFNNANVLPSNPRSITLVNFQPYARKIHLRGARLRGVPPGIVEKVRQITFGKFRSQVKIDLRFIELPAGYVLRKDYIKKTGQLHTRAGKEVTYPALIITQRD